MTIGPFRRLILRHALGNARGRAIVHLLDNIDDNDIASLLRLLVIIRRRGVDEIVSDLAILDQLDRLFGDKCHDQQTDCD